LAHPIVAEDEGNLGRSCAGLCRFEVVLADRIRLQKSEDGSLEASLEQVSRKQTS